MAVSPSCSPATRARFCRGLIDPARWSRGAEAKQPGSLHQKRFAGLSPAEAESPESLWDTFTGEVATMAVNELFHRLTGFREPYGSWSERIRRFDQAKVPDVHAADYPARGCPLCQSRR